MKQYLSRHFGNEAMLTCISNRLPFMSAALILLGQFCILLSVSCNTFADNTNPSDPHFSAPYSGKRVTQYELSLPVGPEQKRSFLIPDACGEAQRAFSQGAQQWGNRVERRIWIKVMQDCDYATFLQRFSTPVLHDYVSSVDFMNIDLRELPLATACSRQEPSGKCIPLPVGVANLGRILGRDPGAEVGQQDNPQACRVRDGLFRGRVDFKANGIECLADPQASGFRIVAVDFADVNGDTYMDVTLRLIPLGPGYPHLPLILPLTRTKSDGPFSIPPNLFAR